MPTGRWPTIVAVAVLLLALVVQLALFVSRQSQTWDEGDHLCPEFQISDAVAGVIKTGVRTARILLKDLVSVTLS